MGSHACAVVIVKKKGRGCTLGGGIAAPMHINGRKKDEEESWAEEEEKKSKPKQHRNVTAGTISGK